jgi:hypothetical protein
MVSDTPMHLTAHKKQLFLSFLGSVQHSAPGSPFIWSAILGAAELGMGDIVTGFGKAPGSELGGALPILTRNRVSILYGSGVSDWNLVPYRDDLGAYAYTMQDIGFTIYMDDRGITDLQTSQEFGNFAHATLSNQIKDALNAKRGIIVSSTISRDLSQYRLFFTDKTALYLTIVGRKVSGITAVTLIDIARCTWSGEKTDGSEVIYFGSDDGFVFQMEKGTSFDGDDIEWTMQLSYNFSKQPRNTKRYRDVALEVTGGGYSRFQLGYSLGYNQTFIEQPADEALTANFAQAFWDSMIWDQFTWDGTTLAPSLAYLEGEAENISLAVKGTSDQYEPFTITGAVLHHTSRKRLRP